MLTCALPPNTGFSAASALIMRRFFWSCRPSFLMYAQIRLVTSVRGIGLSPITSASCGLGVIGCMNAAFARPRPAPLRAPLLFRALDDFPLLRDPLFFAV